MNDPNVFTELKGLVEQLIKAETARDKLKEANKTFAYPNMPKVFEKAEQVSEWQQQLVRFNEHCHTFDSLIQEQESIKWSAMKAMKDVIPESWTGMQLLIRLDKPYGEYAAVIVKRDTGTSVYASLTYVREED